MYDANFPERECVSWDNVPEVKRDALFEQAVREQAVRDLTGEDLEALGRMSPAPEHPKHKDLFPLSIRDVAGWVVSLMILFVAAGVSPTAVDPACCHA